MSVKTKKQIVIEAAAKLFSDKGYSAASMQDLAERVGLKQKSSLYNHIDSKEEALQEICFENAKKFTDGITTIKSTVTEPVEQIRALIDLHIQIATNDITSVTVFNDEWRHLTEPELSEFLALRKDYEERFKEIINKGIQSGVFKKLNPAIALHTILSALKWIHYWYKPERDSDIETVRENIMLLLISGLSSGTSKVSDE